MVPWVLVLPPSAQVCGHSKSLAIHSATTCIRFFNLHIKIITYVATRAHPQKCLDRACQVAMLPLLRE